MTKTLIAAVLSFVSIAAMAQSAPQDAPLTRAQVLAQVEQARAAGTLGVADPALLPIAATGMSRTRAEVKAEVAQAMANGEVMPVRQTEATQFLYSTPASSAKTRVAGNDRRAQLNQWSVEYRNSVYAGS